MPGDSVSGGSEWTVAECLIQIENSVQPQVIVYLVAVYTDNGWVPE